MKKILLSIFVISLLLTSCSTPPKAPLATPDYNRLPEILLSIHNSKAPFKSENESEKVLAKYLKANKQIKDGLIEESCENLEDLKALKHFPLVGVVELKYLNHCEDDKPYFLENEEELTIKDNFHKNLTIKTYYELSKKFNAPKKQIIIGFKLLDILSVKKEKMALLQELMSIAQNNNVSHELISNIQRRLEEISPRFIKEVTPENRFSIAKDFENAREFEIARDHYLEIINNDLILKDRIKAYNAYRMSYKVERNLKVFLEKTGEMELFLRQLLDTNPNDKDIQEAWVDSKINFARAVWTEHMNLEARVILDDIILSKLGTNQQKAQVLWIYGLLHLESKEQELAIEKFELAFKIPQLTKEQEENISWSLIWTNFQAKNYQKQIQITDTVLDQTSNHNLRYKILFWKAKALVNLANFVESKKIFDELTVTDEFGFYGLMSYSQLNKPISALNDIQLKLEPSGDPVLDWLIISGEKELAQSEMKNYQKKIKKVEDKKKFLPNYYFTEWFTGGMNMLLTFPAQDRNQIIKEFLPVFYPILFRKEYITASRKFKVPLAYPLAISRQESNFNPNARSWADAFGLMQLIPEKALELAKRHNINYSTFEDLYYPEINVQLGIALLSDLRKKHDGRFIQSTASYNASDSAVANWQKERFNGDYLEFIENIPYEETRNYIKLVFRNFITYKRIISSESFLVENDFFEKSFN